MTVNSRGSDNDKLICTCVCVCACVQVCVRGYICVYFYMSIHVFHKIVIQAKHYMAVDKSACMYMYL